MEFDMKKTLGDYLKDIERSNITFLEKNTPIYARLDGKGFSKFTKGMERPFDQRFTNIMVAVAKQLMFTTRADLAYVQSDEISLFWDGMDVMDFNGRKEKWVGELSGLATATTMLEVANIFPGREQMLPRFDCRVFNVSEDDALRFFHWRYLDCRKNSVSMVAYNFLSHKSLINVPTKERIQRLHEIDEPWEDYPEQFKYGTFLYKEKKYLPIDKSQIPEHVRDTVPDYSERNVISSKYLSKWDASVVRNMTIND